MPKKKYIFVTGGVTSSLGKGLACASLASLLERRGIKVGLLKMDPYINVDPGTMSPIQHGEVFVTDDGAETDLDLGHYERFTGLTLTKQCNFTSGAVYLKVIENEREGKYLGKTVQVVPHITDEIKRRIDVAASDAEILIGEIGGTVGDIESLPFMEAIRQFAQEKEYQDVLFIHLVLVPYLKAAGELKTKPAQHSVKALQALGVFPQMLLCRSEQDIDTQTLEKLAMFCSVPKGMVFEAVDVDSIYKVPLKFHQQGIDQKIIEHLGIWSAAPNMDTWKKVVESVDYPDGEVVIAIVGKYTDLTESYKSLGEALTHGSIAAKVKLLPKFVDAEMLKSEMDVQNTLKSVCGILVPGGFGERGTEGKIRAIQYARTQKIPFLGICLGLQMAVIEFARNVCKITDAMSEEFTKVGTPVIHYLTGQSDTIRKGGSMRLGAYACEIKKDSKAYGIYQEVEISERHRHRLEVNNEYLEKLTAKGLVVSGVEKSLNLVEIIELPQHPFFLGVQFHPEFKSKPFAPHPLFRDFIKASLCR